MRETSRLILAGLGCAYLIACGSDEPAANAEASGGTSSGGASAGSNNGGSGASGKAGEGATNPGGANAGGAGMGGAGTGGANAGGASSGGTNAGGTNAGGSNAGGSNAGGSGNGGSPTVPAGLLNPDFTTTWNPGILADTQLNKPLGPDGVPVRTQVCATPAPGDDLNQAIAGCPEGQVVQLAAGTYTVSSVVVLNKGVVLRGAGSSGAGATTIVRTGGGSVLAIGGTQDGACYDSAYDAYALTADATKESNVVHLGTNASHFSPGDLALLDVVDDATVDEGDCQYFKRVDKRSVSERVEIASVDTAAGTVILSTPLHFTFRASGAYQGQISRVKQSIVRFAGIESVALEGGSNPGYNGQMAGGVDVSNAAHCWIKDVQTDETIGGMHVSMTGTYRCVVRDSNFHHSANYGFGADCYGIVLRCGAADNLVENNIVRYMNKPVLFNVSGGGNVVGYNYADNSWATPPAWQEVNIDTHCSFPHMELMEGNYAPHMGATTTHGNAGYLTYFRNYASSQFASPAVAGSTAQQTGNIAAIQFDNGDLNMTVIGNVLGSSASNDLGTAPVSAVYIGTDSGSPSIFELGSAGKSDIAYTSLWWHANYDTVTPGVVYNPAITPKTLPSSLYLSGKPAWWPAGVAWPWAGSDLAPMVGSLPAKTRSDSVGP
jgi:hypothetical protein